MEDGIGPLKIGITCYPVYGGSGAVATELGIQLARRGHEVHFISYAHPFRLPYFQERIYFHEVEVPSYPLFDYPPYSLALAVQMHGAAVRHELDLLHVHYAIPHATSAWIAREMLDGRTGPRIITTLHGTDITLVGQDPSYREMTCFSIRKSDGLTAVSSYLRDETVARFDVPADQIEVIPNFVDLEKFRRDREPCHRDKLAPPDERILMHISNFRPVKRVADVVRVFARVAERIPSRLVLIGDGPDRGRVQQTAEDEGVADRVVHLGKQESVAELLACADLFLLPSESEAFGLVALEAMACGVPVVATRVGGVSEVVPHGVAGELHPVGDIDAMAGSAVELLTDDARWRRA
ncbi:MAG: N-acetyl-alpha-D-glucosaminyl L-malate synthase BshA, partial [Gemmatimonadota bacterium]